MLLELMTFDLLVFHLLEIQRVHAYSPLLGIILNLDKINIYGCCMIANVRVSEHDQGCDHLHTINRSCLHEIKDLGVKAFGQD